MLFIKYYLKKISEKKVFKGKNGFTGKPEYFPHP